MISEFINSSEDKLDIQMKPFHEYNSELEQSGWDQEEFDTNGWSVDFWITYSNPKYNFDLMLSGSWYYGNYQISKRYEN